MRKLIFVILAGVLLYALPARAGQAEAREVARINNCNPKKIEVVANNLNQSSQTVYRVDCIMPKIRADGEPNQSEAVLIRCDGTICGLLRAVPKDAK